MMPPFGLLHACGITTVAEAELQKLLGFRGDGYVWFSGLEKDPFHFFH
jgi:hypothetical protein